MLTKTTAQKVEVLVMYQAGKVKDTTITLSEFRKQGHLASQQGGVGTDIQTYYRV